MAWLARLTPGVAKHQRSRQLLTRQIGTGNVQYIIRNTTTYDARWRVDPEGRLKNGSMVCMTSTRIAWLGRALPVAGIERDQASELSGVGWVGRRGLHSAPRRSRVGR